VAEHDLKCPLADGYGCIFPKCVYPGDEDFRDECYQLNDDFVGMKSMPLDDNVAMAVTCNKCCVPMIRSSTLGLLHSVFSCSVCMASVTITVLTK
jgi:hypothetical protein